MNELNPSTLEYIIADLKNKLVSYKEHYLNTVMDLHDSGKALGQIQLLELLISNYENRLSELLIDLDNDRSK